MDDLPSAESAEPEQGTSVYGLDAIEVCVFTQHGQRKALLIAYATHCITQDARAVLKPLFSCVNPPSDGWYEFRCELAEPNTNDIVRVGSIYPPAFHVFEFLPSDIQGVRVYSATVTSQVSTRDFHPELMIAAKDSDAIIIGESHHESVFEAYVDALLDLDILPGPGRPLPRIKGACYGPSYKKTAQTHVLLLRVDPVTEHVVVDVENGSSH